MLFKQLRDLREENNLTQNDMAKILNISQGTYSDYENGVINVPVEAFIKLSEHYKVSVDYILGLTEVRKQPPRINNKKEKMSP